MSVYKNLVKGDTLSFTADVTQSFTTKLTATDLYSFIVDSAPSGQTCTVENASGSISADTTLRVRCGATDSLKTVSGVVTGLSSGQAISLQLNNGETKNLGSGAFSFTSLPEGYQYTLSVLVDGPGKHCAVTNSSGTISGNVKSLISCQAVNILYANGSQYDGNLGGRNGADAKCALIASFMGSHVTCDVNKAFISVNANDQIADFPTLYSVRADLPIYAYDSATIDGEFLFKNDWADLIRPETASFLHYPFSSFAWSGSNDDGTVSGQTCLGFTSNSESQRGTFMFLSGLGAGTSANYCIVPDELGCVCLHQHYQVGGTLSGLTSGDVVMHITYGNHTADDITLVDNGSFYSNQDLDLGETYSATITSAPSSRTCTFTGTSSGTVSGSSSSALTIACEETATFSIGGTVTGLSGTVVLSLNSGAQTASMTADGAFTFGTELAEDATYSVTVGTQPDDQTCTVASGTGTATADVSNITVTCADNAAVLSSIAITPTSPSINFFLAQTQQFTATGTFDDSTTSTITSTATWASSATNIATISASGLATPVGLGTTTITATLDGVTSNAVTLTVAP